jgi:Putative flagellar system-associated repeat
MPQPSEPVYTSSAIPFSPAIPAGFYNSDNQSITGPISFSQPLDPAGSGYSVNLTANGVNVPTFPGMTLTTGSQTWNNVAGVVHWISIDYWTRFRISPQLQYYTIQYDTSVPVIPAVASITCVHGINPTMVISTNGSALNPAFVPAPTAFSITHTPTINNSLAGFPVTSVAVTSNSITLQLSGAIAAGDALSLNYTPTFPGQPPYPISAQDAIGNLLAAITAAIVTVT